MIGRTPLVRFAGRFCFVLGFLVFAYVAGSVAYADAYQRYQSWRFDRSINALSPAELEVFVAEPPALNDGDLIGRLSIPRMGISVMVFHGVEEDTLGIGAGHVPGTPLPGAEGNSAIAAHRDTFFRTLEGIRSGDLIQFSTVRGIYNYVVNATETVAPEDTWVMESRGRQELTLITCYPFHFLGSAPKRFIVHAKPTE